MARYHRWKSGINFRQRFSPVAVRPRTQGLRRLGKEVGEEWNLSRKYLSSTRYLYHPISMYPCIYMYIRVYMHTFHLLADNFPENTKNPLISRVVEHSTSSLQSKASVYAHKNVMFDRNTTCLYIYIIILLRRFSFFTIHIIRYDSFFAMPYLSKTPNRYLFDITLHTRRNLRLDKLAVINGDTA